MPAYLGIIYSVVECDAQDLRFESYANAIVSVIEQQAVLSTSRSWDLGRDGITIQRTKIFVCSSLNTTIDKKSLKDLERLKTTKANPEKVYFCSSRDLSEHTKQKLKDELQRKFPWRIEVLGGRQLVEFDLANADKTNSPSNAENHYRSEIEDCNRRLSEQSTNDASLEAMRLALMALGASPTDPRSELGAALVLSLYSADSGLGLSPNHAAKQLSNRLKLNSTISSTTITTLLKSLEQKSFLIEAEGLFYLDSKGKTALQEMTTKGAASLPLLRQIA